MLLAHATAALLSLIPVLIDAAPVPKDIPMAKNSSTIESTLSPNSTNAEVFHMAPGPMIPNETMSKPTQVKREDSIVIPSSMPSNLDLPTGPGPMVPNQMPPRPVKRGEGNIRPYSEASTFEVPMGPPVIPTRVLLLSDQVKRDGAIVLPSTVPSDTDVSAGVGPIIPEYAFPSPVSTQEKRDETIVLPSSAPINTESKPDIVTMTSQIDGGDLLEFLRKVAHASSEEERKKIVKESKYAEDYEKLRKVLAVGL